MKTLLTTLLVVLVAGGALAQDRMGVSGSTDSEMDYINITSGVPFDFYICIFDPSSDTIGGYECMIGFTNADAPILVAVGGPNGWTNFGDNFNHLVGFQTPVPGAAVTVVCTINALVVSPPPYETLVTMGASEPSSFDGAGPGYADGANPEVLVLCSVPADGIVGTISTEVVATEARSLSGVKALFD